MLVSPEKMMNKATGWLGKQPETPEEWTDIIRFFVVNIDREHTLPCCRLLCLLYDIPLADEELDQIIDSQLKAEKQAANLLGITPENLRTITRFCLNPPEESEDEVNNFNHCLGNDSPRVPNSPG